MEFVPIVEKKVESQKKYVSFYFAASCCRDRQKVQADIRDVQLSLGDRISSDLSEHYDSLIVCHVFVCKWLHICVFD